MLKTRMRNYTHRCSFLV